MTPYIIGIAGGSASGKTTCALALAEALGGMRVRVIHLDDYFKPEEQRPRAKGPVTGAQYLDDNHPLTMDLPKAAQDLAEAAASGAHQAIIIEGLLTLWDDAICAQLNLKLFVDCRADERIVRRLRRNMRWGLGFDEIANVYLDLVRYRHDEYVEPSKWRADFILNGSQPSDKAIEMIAKHVGAACQPPAK